MVGEVQDKTVLMVDDMISTAGTITEAARIVMDRGAKRVLAAATHGVLVGLAVERLASARIDRIILTDSIPLDDRCKPIAGKLIEQSVAPLMGEAIRRIHHNVSVSALFQERVGSKR